MKTICAWCNKTMSDTGNSTLVSHGLCPECEAKYFPTNRNKVSAPLSQSNAIRNTIQSAFCFSMLCLIGCVQPHYIKKEPEIVLRRGPDVLNAPVNEGHGGMIEYSHNDERPSAYQKMHDYCSGNYRITSDIVKERMIGTHGGTTASTLNFIPSIGPTTIANQQMITLIKRWHEIAFECEK